MRRPRATAAIALLALASTAEPSDDLLVFAAASLTDALTEIGARFEERSPVGVSFHFAGSAALARQIRAGAPADVFVSADAERIRELREHEAIESAEIREFLTNELVAVVPRGEPGPAGPDQLPRYHRIAIGDPELVPAGRYARSYGISGGWWALLAGRLVPLPDVRAVAAAVAARHAAVGIVYRTDAVRFAGLDVAFALVPDDGAPIVYAIAPLRTSRNSESAAFVRFATSPVAHAIYERHGFRSLQRP